jgi:Zn ribbon nucleic-acid-binding protein
MSRNNHKYCPNCDSDRVIKRGNQDGMQIYFCKECGTRFRNKRKHKDFIKEEIWNEFVFHKQTLRELVMRLGIDKKTLHKYLNEYKVKLKTDHIPRVIYLVVDATYFRLRKDDTSWGVILFRDANRRENLWWKFVKRESQIDYLEGKIYLESLGYIVKSVTCDGFKGNIPVFKGVPIQMCHFHMKQIIIRNVTLNPKTEAGQVILALSHTLKYTDRETFAKRLREYHVKYIDFLNEKTLHPDGSKSYTHEGVRSAYISLCFWFEYLFTYKSDINIPNTTNTCDGHFSHLKDVIRIHRGMKDALKRKVIDAIFLESTIAPKQK